MLFSVSTICAVAQRQKTGACLSGD